MCEDGQNALMGSETGIALDASKNREAEYREGRNEKYRQEKREKDYHGYIETKTTNAEKKTDTDGAADGMGRVLIKGSGDLASGIALRLHRAD